MTANLMRGRVRGAACRAVLEVPMTATDPARPARNSRRPTGCVSIFASTLPVAPPAGTCYTRAAPRVNLGAREDSMMRRVLSICVMAAACLPGAARAQTVSGTILGTVTDSTGAVMASAKITVVNEGTALTRTVIADAKGEYTAPSLPTGRYTVIAEVPGFKTLTLSNI